MPNAIDLLKADHTHVKALFQQYDAAGKRAYQKKQGIAEEVFTELEVLPRWRKSCSTRP
jgi:hypothetical protein